MLTRDGSAFCRSITSQSSPPSGAGIVKGSDQRARSSRPNAVRIAHCAPLIRIEPVKLSGTALERGRDLPGPVSVALINRGSAS